MLDAETEVLDDIVIEIFCEVVDDRDVVIDDDCDFDDDVDVVDDLDFVTADGDGDRVDVPELEVVSLAVSERVDDEEGLAKLLD